MNQIVVLANRLSVARNKIARSDVQVRFSFFYAGRLYISESFDSRKIDEPILCSRCDSIKEISIISGTSYSKISLEAFKKFFKIKDIQFVISDRSRSEDIYFIGLKMNIIK